MKYLNYLLVIFCFLLSNCGTTPVEVDETYLLGTWSAGPQILSFHNDTSATLIIARADDETKKDTMNIRYTFAPDSTPMQLDMRVEEGMLRGMNMFGLIEIPHRDTFRTASKMGFEGQGAKYRPKSMADQKIGTYVRIK